MRMNRYRAFFELFAGHGIRYLIGILFLIAINIVMLTIPKLTGAAVDTLEHGKEGLSEYIWLFLMAGIAVSILKFISRHLFLGSIRHLEFQLRERLFRHALRLPISYYETNGPGKVMALMTNDITSLRVSLGLGVMLFVDALFFAVVSFVIMSHDMSFETAAVTLLPMPFLLLMMLGVTRTMRRRQRAAQETYSDLTEFVQELFQGMPAIRAFNKEARSIERFSDINLRNYTGNMKVAAADAVIAPLTYVAPFICMATGMYITGLMVIRGELDVGDFVALNGYLFLIIGPLMGLGSLASVLQKGLASWDRIRNFFAIEAERADESGETLPEGDIEIRNLSYVYEGTDYAALSDVSVTIPFGAFYGIVGTPGSGKSTLFTLLSGLRTPERGRMFIAGRDIRDYPADAVRRGFSYVPAQPYVLGATVRENISFGEEEADARTDARIGEAAASAALERDLNERLKPAKSELREGGGDLSGGQRLRVNIARGLFKRAPYLLLDDSFSSLDRISAAHVSKALRQAERRTILFVSHRAEALRDADCILVFHEGRIVETGTYDELMKYDSLYRKLYADREGEEASNVE